MSADIAHVAVYAADLEKTKDFFTVFFDGKCGALYRNNRGLTSYFISFGNGARLEVMHSENMKCRKPSELESGWDHVAFSVGSKDDVDSLTQKKSFRPGIRFTVHRGKPATAIMKAVLATRTATASKSQFDLKKITVPAV